MWFGSPSHRAVVLGVLIDEAKSVLMGDFRSRNFDVIRERILKTGPEKADLQHMLQCPSLRCWLAGVLSEVGVQGLCLALRVGWLLLTRWYLLVLCCNYIFEIIGVVLW